MVDVKICLLVNYINAYIVGFMAAAVSMPMGGCRARRPKWSVAVVTVVVPVAAAEPAVL